jgi:hypothetical protein
MRLVKIRFEIILLLAGILIITACSSPTSTAPPASAAMPVEMQVTDTPQLESSPSPDGADVVAVEVRGEAGAYSFSVTVKSPDEGCDRYADWWEVIGPDGELIYRRVLLHSHVEEQPFTRSGGAVQIEADRVVWIRAHMHPDGYGGSAMRGSVGSGFEPAGLDKDFAFDLAQTSPLPEGCDF